MRYCVQQFINQKMMEGNYIIRWTKAPVDTDVLVDLVRKASLLSFKQKWFYIFSKCGFTERLSTEADRHPNVRLIRFEEMI